MNFRDLDLNLLLLLNALFDERSVSRTAARLGISQPAVSASLGRLREFFDDQLFVRSANGLLPTAYADSLCEPVRRIVELIDNEIMQSRQFDPLESTRAFAITTSDIGEAHFLPGLLRKMNREAPQCMVQSASFPPKRLAEVMERGEIDLAVGYFPDLDTKGFHSQSLAMEPLVCIARRDHPDVGDTIDLETFGRVPQAVVTHEARGQHAYEQLVVDQRIVRNIRTRIAHFTSVPVVIAATDLIAVVPRGLAELYSEMAKFKLKQVELPFAAPPLELKQYWHQRTHRDPASRWLRSVITALYKE